MKKLVLFMLVLSLLSGGVLGCTNGSSNDAVNDSTQQETDDNISTISLAYEDIKEEFGLDLEQKNSFSMLYYLAITAENIRISKNNRVMLDEIYDSLLNDINPSAIDETTQLHLTSLRDVIKDYINIEVKRERLQFIYNQDKANSIRNAVPNPLSVLTMTNSLDWKKLVVGAVFTAVDSYNNYKKTNEALDQKFIIDGWELDDMETETIQRNRERAFDYMVDMVQEYKLDGKLTLNEKAIEDFATICEITNVHQKIKRLEAEYDTYKLLGNYWLELADCYYEINEYSKCLDCVNRYRELSTGIYRKDSNYALILPKAIVSAQMVYKDDKYVEIIDLLAEELIDNTNTEDWSIRYFAAQVYLDLYSKTNMKDYMKIAYEIIYDNVVILIEEQQKINDTYLNDVQLVTIDEPDYRYMTKSEKKQAKRDYEEEKKKLKDYNDNLKETRKTELPTVYEPLLLNCDLLFALSNELGIDEKEKNEIKNVLQIRTNGIFLSNPINQKYSFDSTKSSYNIEVKKDHIGIPVNELNNNTVITMTAQKDGESFVFDDCEIYKVERKSDTVDKFIAYVSSEKMKAFKWKKDATLTISIKNEENGTKTFKYQVSKFDSGFIDQLIEDKVEFKEL